MTSQFPTDSTQPPTDRAETPNPNETLDDSLGSVGEDLLEPLEAAVGQPGNHR
jgi:hypothetical protein